MTDPSPIRSTAAIALLLAEGVDGTSLAAIAQSLPVPRIVLIVAEATPTPDLVSAASAFGAQLVLVPAGQAVARIGFEAGRLVSLHPSATWLIAAPGLEVVRGMVAAAGGTVLEEPPAPTKVVEPSPVSVEPQPPGLGLPAPETNHEEKAADEAPIRQPAVRGPRIAPRPPRIVADEPKPVAPPALGSLITIEPDMPAGVSVTPVFVSLVEALPSIPHDDGELAGTVTGILDAVSRIGEWDECARDHQRLLLAYLVSLIRYLQHEDLGSVELTALDRAFALLAQFSRTRRPGAVTGLARRHNEDWLVQAQKALEALREDAGLETEADRNRRRKHHLAELKRAVRHWQKNPVQAHVDVVAHWSRECLAAGIPRTSPDLAALLKPLFEAGLLPGRQFRDLRSNAATVQPLRAEPAPAESGAEHGTRQSPLVCTQPECQALASARLGDAAWEPADNPTDCSICEGSNNQRSAAMLAATLAGLEARHDPARILVVGGTADARTEIKQVLKRHGIEVRTVDPDQNRQTAQAIKDMEWADLTIVNIVGNSHKVTERYRNNRPVGVRLLMAQGGVDSMCRRALEYLQHGDGGQGESDAAG